MTVNKGRVRIAFLLEKDPRLNTGPWVSCVTRETIDLLEKKGAGVELIVPEDSLWDLSGPMPGQDLHVLKSETSLALSLAGALTLRGAALLNTFSAVNLVRDKIAATAVLAASGIPVPASFATGEGALLAPLLKEGPLWVKSWRGTKGKGVKRISDSKELGEGSQLLDTYGLPLPFFAQKEVPSHGKDLKVYIAGERAWAIERPFPAATERDKEGKRVDLQNDIREAAFACGRALGLEIYGVDFLISADGFSVIDVNAFPGYKGIEEAPEALAECIFKNAVLAQERSGPKR